MRWSPSYVAGWLLAFATAAAVVLHGFLLTENLVSNPATFVGTQEHIAFVQKNFPNEYANGMPDGSKIALLLDTAKVVRGSAKVSGAATEPLDLVLKRAFPLLKITAKTKTGVVCFPAELATHGKFCLIYAQPEWL